MSTSIDSWILGSGLIAVGATVFIETGLLIGFILPGDTLLFSAGILAAQNVFSLPSLIIVVIVAAIAGDNVAYSIGRRSGAKLYGKKESVFFRAEHLERAELFYEKHGGKSLILARFIPVLRTFAPMVAGATKMSRKRFMTYNVVGAILWTTSIILLGYWLGQKLPWLENYITPFILLVVLFTISVALYHLLKDKEVRELFIGRVKLFLSNLFLNKKVK